MVCARAWGESRRRGAAVDELADGIAVVLVELHGRRRVGERLGRARLGEQVDCPLGARGRRTPELFLPGDDEPFGTLEIQATARDMSRERVHTTDLWLQPQELRRDARGRVAEALAEAHAYERESLADENSVEAPPHAAETNEHRLGSVDEVHSARCSWVGAVPQT